MNPTIIPVDVETGLPQVRESVYLWLTNSSVLQWIARPLYRRDKPSELGETFNDDVWILLAAKVGQIADRFINVYTFWYIHLLALSMIGLRRLFGIFELGPWSGIVSTLLPLFISIIVTAMISARNHKVAQEIQRCREELAATIMMQGYSLTMQTIKPRNCMVQHNYVLVLRPMETEPVRNIVYPNECIVVTEGLVALFAGLFSTLAVDYFL